MMKVEDFIGRIQHYQSYKKGANEKANHCSDCVWILSKLNVMYKKAEEYAKMRKTDDDKIEWNTLILETLDMPEESQTIKGPSPVKKPKMVEQPKKVAEESTKTVEDPKKGNVLETRIEQMMHDLAEATATEDIYDGETFECFETSGDGSEEQEDEQTEEESPVEESFVEKSE